MALDLSENANLQLLSELEQRVCKLLDAHSRLTEENQALKKQHEKLSSEKASMYERNRQAHSKIESMLARLKTLEQQ